MIVESLHVYPIKSCGGVSVLKMDLDKKGPRFDRRYMIVDEQGNFITQRTEHGLTQVRCALVEQAICVQHEDKTLRLPESVTGRGMAVSVWRSKVDAVEVREGSEFFTQVLGRRVYLVHMPNSSPRAINPKFSDPTDDVSFADGYPLLLIGQASLDDLNSRLVDDPVHPLSMRRFRPNVVMSGGAPFQEDQFSRVRLGAVSFRGVKRCDRCVMTTLDPDTGTQSKEPLRTLAGYRKEDGNVLFGMNLIHDSIGVLRVGDAVEVLDARV